MIVEIIKCRKFECQNLNVKIIKCQKSESRKFDNRKNEMSKTSLWKI